MQEAIKQWNIATEQLVIRFAKKHFGSDPDMYWIADDVGGVLFINDYFFSMSDIVDFIRYKYTPKQMFEYYDYRMDMYNKEDTVINIKNYKKLK